jgi:lipopolysaccharide export system permease protein
MYEKNKSDLRTVRLQSVKDLPADFKIHTDIGKWNPWNKIPILNRYIFLEILGPFVVALAFFTTVFMTISIQKMIGLIAGKGVDFFRLLDYLGYILGNTLPSTIPMACLMSGIMASGRLSGDSEITAMRSAGISFFRIYVNFLVFGLLCAVLVTYLNFYLGPENTKKMNEFNNWIAAYNPMLAVTPGQFSGDSSEALQKKSRTLYTDGMNQETGELFGIQIREWEIFEMKGGDFIQHNGITIPMGGSRLLQVISAKRGQIIEKKNSKGEFEKSVRLKDGFVLEWNEKKDGYVVTNFMGGEMDYNVPSEKETKLIGFNIKPDTFSFPDLLSIRRSIESEGLENIPGLEILKELNIKIKGVNGLKEIVQKMKLEIIELANKPDANPEETMNRVAVLTQLEGLLKDTKKTLISFNVEIHKRIAMPISCQIFFFLSFPLGLVVKRSGKGMSFTLAIIFLFIYYAFFIFGTNISYKSGIPDWIGPWSANMVIGSISIYIMFSRTDITLRHTKLGKVYFKFSEKISPIFRKIGLFISPITSIISKLYFFISEKISTVFSKLKNKFYSKKTLE